MSLFNNWNLYFSRVIEFLTLRFQGWENPSICYRIGRELKIDKVFTRLNLPNLFTEKKISHFSQKDATFYGHSKRDAEISLSEISFFFLFFFYFFFILFFVHCCLLCQFVHLNLNSYLLSKCGWQKLFKKLKILNIFLS